MESRLRRQSAWLHDDFEKLQHAWPDDSFTGQGRDPKPRRFEHDRRAENHPETGHRRFLPSRGAVFGGVPADYHFPKASSGLGSPDVVFRRVGVHGFFHLPLLYFLPAQARGGAFGHHRETRGRRPIVRGRPPGGALLVKFNPKISRGLELSGDFHPVGDCDWHRLDAALTRLRPRETWERKKCASFGKNRQGWRPGGAV